MKCFSCGNFGHRKSECPRITSSSSDRCFSCGNVGHRKSECKNNLTSSSTVRQGPSSLKECYDCHDMVSDIKMHRDVCPKSRLAKSVINSSPSNNNAPTQANILVRQEQKDFYFLIDVSGLMSGSRLDTAKECVQNVVEKMDVLDRMAIITFDSSAFFKLKPRPVEEIIRKKELEPILKKIFAQGSTALYDAINMAVLEI